MNFSDNIIREKLDVVFIKSNEKDFDQREEFNSNLWDVEIYDLHNKVNKAPVHLYSVPARAVKIGEDIYDKLGNFIAYRVD